MKKIILILIAITAITEGCKKYEEGSCFSLRSAKSKFKGIFTLKQYTINGIDSLDSYYDSLGLTFEFWHFEDNNADVCIMNGYRKDGAMADLYWGWELINHNKIFKVLGTDGASNGIGVFKRNITPEWRIIKLKKDDIIMQTNFNGNEYYVELKRGLV